MKSRSDKNAPDCPFCEGTGKRAPLNGHSCPVCEGKGTIFVDYHSHAGDEVCAACGGTGEVTQPVTCEACRGTGRV